MALDGIFLRFLCSELNAQLAGARVDKIFQPSKYDIVFSMRTRQKAFKLLISANADSPRLHITENAPENPPNPPMLCMLLRKKLCGCVLTGIRQHQSDRIVFIDFTGTDELGDRVNYTLCIEIMAKHSNIILLNSENVVIDSVKRVDASKSSFRTVLPGAKYAFPPEQNKTNLLKSTVDEIVNKISSESDLRISKALLKHIQGVSPDIARELSYRCAGDDILRSQASENVFVKLTDELSGIAEMAETASAQPTAILDGNSKPVKFSYMPFMNIDPSYSCVKFSSCSELLDYFYREKDRSDRVHQRAQDLFHILTSAIERISKKINVRTAELEKCADKETLRIYAELISANIYRLPKGVPYYELENYYDENKIIRIPCDSSLSPSRNSQKYFKEYKKAVTAEKMLAELIEDGKNELEYAKSLLDILQRCTLEEDISGVREEMRQSGYIKADRNAKARQKKKTPSEPMRFISDSGIEILVGRNNLQNDRLTLKTASKQDLWFHLKNAPGSHAVLRCAAGETDELSIFQTAVLAAWFSSARTSPKVEIDYTQVKNVKKPSGAKPGMVIYDNYRTIVVEPNEELAERLAINNRR